MPLTRPKAAQVDFDVTNITDPLIRINSGESGSADKDTGIVMERGSDGNVALIWDESADGFALINTDEIGTTAGDVTISSYADLTLKRITQSEQQYTTSNMMKFNQMYTGAATGSYFDPNEYQKVLTITPAGNSENYQVSGRIMAQNAGDIHTIYFTAALRSGDPLPDLSWNITYTEDYNGSRYIDPQLWTKETTTAGFIFAFKVLSRIYGTVTVDIDVIPRTSSLKSNVVMNTTQDSEQTTIDTGFTANDMTKVYAINGQNLTLSGTISGDGSSLTGVSSYDELASDGYGTLTVTSTVADNAAGPILELYRNSASPADADYIGQLKFQGENDAGQKVVYGKITAKMDDVTDGTEDGIFEITHRKAGSNNISARWTSDALKLINGTGLEVDQNITTEGGDALFRNSAGGSVLSVISNTSSNSIIKMGDTADFDIGQIVYNNSNNSMIFHVNDADAMTIASDGTVTASVFSGTATQAQYADLAEIYASDEKYAPGTVLIFGGDAEVTTTTMMADHRVAGVVSTNPAYLMNSDAEGVAVALRGRIPCFVEGPVHKGDIIVSGIKAGTGVALTKDSALPNAVCVVGKAIEENLETGVKLIEVVV